MFSVEPKGHHRRSAQRVANEALQTGEYASQARLAYDSSDIRQTLAQLDQAGDHIIAARDETQGPLWAAAEWVPCNGSSSIGAHDIRPLQPDTQPRKQQQPHRSNH